MKELIRLNRVKTNSYVSLYASKDPIRYCPFENECMHCYEIFPGWGDMYLDERCYRSVFPYTKESRVYQSSCPCITLGQEFVRKAVNDHLKKED